MYTCKPSNPGTTNSVKRMAAYTMCCINNYKEQNLIRVSVSWSVRYIFVSHCRLTRMRTAGQCVGASPVETGKESLMSWCPMVLLLVRDSVHVESSFTSQVFFQTHMTLCYSSFP